MSDATTAATSPAAFERRYRSASDPWNFASSPYERAKYEVTVAALSRTRYTSAYEPGCAIGELTALLAPRCDRLLATDIAPTAVARARHRCAAFSNVRIECADVLEMPPNQKFDLIMLSEIGYYFDVHTLAVLARRLSVALEVDGELVAVHWLGQSADHVLHGDEVHQILREQLSVSRALSERHPLFRLDTWRKLR